MLCPIFLVVVFVRVRVELDVPLSSSSSSSSSSSVFLVLLFVGFFLSSFFRLVVFEPVRSRQPAIVHSVPRVLLVRLAVFVFLSSHLDDAFFSKNTEEVVAVVLVFPPLLPFASSSSSSSFTSSRFSLCTKSDATRRFRDDVEVKSFPVASSRTVGTERTFFFFCLLRRRRRHRHVQHLSPPLEHTRKSRASSSSVVGKRVVVGVVVVVGGGVPSRVCPSRERKSPRRSRVSLKEEQKVMYNSSSKTLNPTRPYLGF